MMRFGAGGLLPPRHGRVPPSPARARPGAPLRSPAFITPPSVPRAAHGAPEGVGAAGPGRAVCAGAGGVVRAATGSGGLSLYGPAQGVARMRAGLDVSSLQLAPGADGARGAFS